MPPLVATLFKEQSSFEGRAAHGHLRVTDYSEAERATTVRVDGFVRGRVVDMICRCGEFAAAIRIDFGGRRRLHMMSIMPWNRAKSAQKSADNRNNSAR